MLSERGDRGPLLLIALTFLSVLLPASAPSVSSSPAIPETEGPPHAASSAAASASEAAAAPLGDEECPNQLPVLARCTEHLVSTLKDFFFELPRRQAVGPMRSPETCAPLPSLYDARVLIATVVDPVASGLKGQFDRNIEAMIHGVENGGYRRDRFWTPWHPLGTANRASAASDAESMNACAKQLPGVMLFRPTPKSGNGPLVVLLVGETPTWGVQKRALVTALDLTASNMRTASPPGPQRISILGPSFSGSAYSLQAVLTSWKPRDEGSAFDFEVVSGSATSPGNRFFFPERGEMAFSATTIPDDILQQTFYAYLVAKGKTGATCLDGKTCLLDHVATLSEGGTAYGARVEADPSEKARMTYLPGLQLDFPLHIASVRAKYEERKRQSAPKAGPIAEYVPATSLDPTLDDATVRSDTPQPLSTQTAVSDDLLLSRIITALSGSHIRYLGIMATDSADTVFLAEQIRKRRPDVRIFAFESDTIYTHPALASAMQGMLLVSPYPLLPGPTEASREFGFFPASSTAGLYRAAKLLAQHQAHDELKPAVWVSSVGAGGPQLLFFDASYEDERHYLHPSIPAERDPNSILPRRPSPSFGILALAVLGFCEWQLGGFALNLLFPRTGGGKRGHRRWLETIRLALRPRPRISLGNDDRNDLRTQLLAALTIGSIAAIALVVALPFESDSTGTIIAFDPKARALALGLTAAIGLTALGCLVLLQARTTRARLAALAAIAPPLFAALAFTGLRADLLVPEKLLFLARATAITSRLSPVAPLLFCMGLVYLAFLIHLKRTRIRAAWNWIEAGRRSIGGPAHLPPRWPVTLVSAATTILVIAVLFALDPVLTLEGRFGDRLFTVAFVAMATVVTTALALFAAQSTHLRRQLKELELRYDEPRLTAAMRRLPTPLTVGARPPGFVPDRDRLTGCLTDMLDWLDRTAPSFVLWASQPGRLLSGGVPIVSEPPAQNHFDAGAPERIFLEACMRCRRLEPVLRWFWSAPTCAWPNGGEWPKAAEHGAAERNAAGALAWLQKAEELVAASETMPFYPVMGELKELLVLCVGGSLLCGLAVASYAFQPERLLATIFSVILMAVLALTFVAIIVFERNEVMSALTRTAPKITWTSFLARAFVWVGLPLLAYIAMQYPVTTNYVASWLDPIARMVR